MHLHNKNLNNTSVFFMNRSIGSYKYRYVSDTVHYVYMCSSQIYECYYIVVRKSILQSQLKDVWNLQQYMSKAKTTLLMWSLRQWWIGQWSIG